jgi:hypothetical protein
MRYSRIEACEHCGADFEKRQPVVRFCSKECKFKHIISSVQPTDSGCVLWPRNLFPKTGYGQFNFLKDKRHRTILAHRMSYIVFNGAITDGLQVLHKCDVRNCVNPEHLFLGTQKDNIKDMLAKGRHKNIARNLGEYATRKASSRRSLAGFYNRT